MIEESGTIKEAAPESAAPETSPLTTIAQLQARIAELEAEVFGLEAEVADLEDQVEALADDDPDDLLRNIRSEIKRGDIEEALLLIHYELGDY